MLLTIARACTCADLEETRTPKLSGPRPLHIQFFICFEFYNSSAEHSNRPGRQRIKEVTRFQTTPTPPLSLFSSCRNIPTTMLFLIK